MAILGIRLIGDPVLGTPSEPVRDFGPMLERLVSDMEQTMLAVDGAGLAAPQIGVSLRVFTYSVEGRTGHVVNPVLEVSEDYQDGPEGCLSVPGLGFVTPRRRWARVTGQDIRGRDIAVEGDGLLARALQHETDHLDGRLFISRLAAAERREAMRRIRDLDYNSVAARTETERAATVGSSFTRVHAPSAGRRSGTLG